MGEKVNAAVDFLKQNRRAVLRLSLYFLLPVAIIQAVAVYSFGNIGDDFFSDALGSKFISYCLAFLFAALFVYTLVLAVVIVYDRGGPQALDTIKVKELLPELWHTFKRVFVCLFVDSLFVVPLFMVLAVFMFLPFVGLLVFGLVFLFLGMMALLPVVYALDSENGSFSAAFGTTWRFSWAQWGKLMGLMFVLFLIITIMNGVVDLPFYGLIFIREMFWETSIRESVGEMIIYNVVFYLWSVIKCFYSYLTYTLALLVLVYHYGSVADVEDDASILSDIRNFKEL